MILYVATVVWGLHAVGFWTFGLLKVTVLWFFTSALVVALNFTTITGEKSVFAAVFVDNVKGILLVEFLINRYTFPLIVELVLIPVSAFVAGLDAFAQRKEEYADVAKLIKWTQAILGFVILALAISSAVADFSNLRSFDTARLILTPPLLSLLLVPFIYLLIVYATYERLFTNLKVGPEKDASVKSYAKRQLVINLQLDLRNIRAFLRGHGRKLIRVRTRSDVDTLFEEWANRRQ